MAFTGWFAAAEIRKVNCLVGPIGATELVASAITRQDEIRAWVRAREYSNRASEYLELARL